MSAPSAQSSPPLLRGKVALVVGGGAAGRSRMPGQPPMGNGRAICVQLALDGADVAVADVRLEAAEATLAMLEEHGGTAVSVPVDAADPDSCRGAVAATIDALGRLDVVVLNVGVHGNLRLRQQTVEEWDRSLAINARAHWVVAQAAIEPMLQAGGGAFVFVCSAAAVASTGLSVSYEASKAAQLAIMRHLAVRFGSRGIRSNAVILGAIDSGMVRQLFGDSEGETGTRDAMVPAARQGTPEEVGAVVAFLASDHARYVNGAAVPVDGGLTAASPLWRPRRVSD